MKKIILILFLFCLLYACYYIYNATEDHDIDIVLIGDSVVDNLHLKQMDNIDLINKDFVNKDYHITDVVNIFRYNQEKNISGKAESIYQLLNEADIVIISIGTNDIYYKLNDDTKEVYTYLNSIIDNYEKILKEIKRYDYKKVFVLGYYNIANRNNDIFCYVNYKLKNMVNEYGYEYLDLNKILYNNEKYYVKNDTFYLNETGYDKIYQLIVEKLEKY